MQQRVDFITFATADLAAARSFYQHGLHWQPLLDVPDEIVFFQIGPGLVL
ncbi:MAG: VOC family protein, partial [Nakamurella sp.]